MAYAIMAVSVKGDQILDKIIKEQPKIAVKALNSATQAAANFLVTKFVDAGVVPGLAAKKVVVTKATGSRLVSSVKYKVNAVRLTSLSQVNGRTMTASGSRPLNKPFHANVPRSRVNARPAVTGVFARETKHRLKIDMLYNPMDNVVTDSDRDDMIEMVQQQFYDEVVSRFKALRGES